jgi:hypothetical protein
VLAPIGWLAGVRPLVVVGQAGFLVVTAAGLGLAVAALRRGERGMPAWFLAGVLAIAAADLDVARGAGSAGLGWLLGFGCLGMAAHVHRRPSARRAARPLPLRAALASLDQQLQLVEEMRDLPVPPASPLGGPPPVAERADDLLGVADGSLYEAKRDGRKRAR